MASDIERPCDTGIENDEVLRNVLLVRVPVGGHARGLHRIEDPTNGCHVRLSKSMWSVAHGSPPFIGEDQTALNIRERAGRRKQKAAR